MVQIGYRMISHQEVLLENIDYVLLGTSLVRSDLYLWYSLFIPQTFSYKMKYELNLSSNNKIDSIQDKYVSNLGNTLISISMYLGETSAYYAPALAGQSKQFSLNLRRVQKG